jgi:hypothetical protein
MEWERNLKLYWPCLHKRIKRQRGLGTLATFGPWLGLREEPGDGTFASPLGLHTGRRHQLRTKAAEGYFYLLERRPDVHDIRELFPILDLDATLQVCGNLGIKHEYHGPDPEPFVIDFMITRRVGDGFAYSARSLMPVSGDLSPQRRVQFQVLNTWCKSVEVDWRPVDISAITETLVETLDFVRGWHREGYVPEREAIEVFTKTFEQIYRKGSTLAELMQDCSAKTGESIQRCLNHFRYACWAEFIKIDIRRELAMNKPVKLHAKAER